MKTTLFILFICYCWLFSVRQYFGLSAKATARGTSAEQTAFPTVFGDMPAF